MTPIIIIDEEVFVPDCIRRAALIMLLLPGIAPTKIEMHKPIGEVRKQIKHGPQYNTRKGKQRRW